ncbi:MAG: asparagine synthase-related protein [Synechococcaceae cyanobacterium]|nr:asparagine synthase-related protein [Synechococcaceae cyanobacterium]
MCGLVGYNSHPAAAPPSGALRLALQRLSHRGPDDSGMYRDEARGLGLAHARLAILDLSPLGHQPMASDDGQTVLVFNGEIYNFPALRTELEAEGLRFRSRSDTEVLLALYGRHRGDVGAMLRRLNGIFAFALWDAREGRLLLARDGLGVKPLYVAVGAGAEGETPMEGSQAAVALSGPFGRSAPAAPRIAFASELKALMPLLPHPGPLDAASLERYLTFLWCPGDGTPLAGVRRLPPGQAWWLQQGRVVERLQWYRLPPPGLPRRPRPSAAAAIAGTTAQLRQAVHRQLLADVPVGAFLSGGLDSSAIVALARERDPAIRCFTIDTPGGQDDGLGDDLPYAREVADHLGVSLEVVRVDPEAMASGLAAMVAQLDEPLADPAPLNVLAICSLARQQGLKVLLSGAGGDDLFTGYRRHRALRLQQRSDWLPRRLGRRLAPLAARLDQRRALGRRLRRLSEGLGLRGDERLVQAFRWARRDDLEPLYSPDFRAALQAAEVRAEAPLLEFLAGYPEVRDPLDRLLLLEQRFFLADHNLLYTDKMSMAVGVEVRVPFLDPELVAHAASLPATFKQRGACGKWVLKQAMAPLLPARVIHRPKAGFGAPLRRWLRGELRPLLQDLLSPASLARRGLFAPAPVQALIRADAEGLVDGSYTLLSLMCIELWCRHCLDAGSIPSPPL